MSFKGRDLIALEELLSSADAVVPMREIYQGERGENVIGLRHDVDDNPGSLDTAVKMAAWEADRGFHSTFFILHTASYFYEPGLSDDLDFIAACGHEIGIHANALAEALWTREDPEDILLVALDRLRSYGFTTQGVAAHGDVMCHRCSFVNDEMFEECARPEMGKPDRFISFEDYKLKLKPRPLSEFGLLYDTHRLPHGRYLSDSGGRWNEPFPGEGDGQLHMLWHSDWWGGAFKTKVAA